MGCWDDDAPGAEDWDDDERAELFDGGYEDEGVLCCCDDQECVVCGERDYEDW